MCGESISRRRLSLGFTTETFPEGQHICYIYSNDEERLQVMAKYVESGLLGGEKVLYLADTMEPQAMIAYLKESGVDVHSGGEDLTVGDSMSGYCPSGVFSVDGMLGQIRRFYLGAVEDGYTGARGTGEMTWCLRNGYADDVSLMEYEAKLNLLVAEHPYTACCQYDARRFDGRIIMDVLHVHPVMIVRGQLVRNPYFLEPQVFLEELSERKKNGVH